MPVCLPTRTQWKEMPNKFSKERKRRASRVKSKQQIEISTRKLLVFQETHIQAENEHLTLFKPFPLMEKELVIGLKIGQVKERENTVV